MDNQEMLKEAITYQLEDRNSNSSVTQADTLSISHNKLSQ